MADEMKWEPIADCPAGTDVLFLFDEGDCDRYAVQGFRTENRFANPPIYYIGFEAGSMTINIRSKLEPVAFALITLPDFLSDGDE
jgi:hypothetical protein